MQFRKWLLKFDNWVEAQDNLPEAKAKVYMQFLINCPYCEKKSKYEDFLSQEGAQMHDRIQQILSNQQGKTNIVIQCKFCAKEYKVTSFNI